MGGIGFIEQLPAINGFQQPGGFQEFASTGTAKFFDVILVLFDCCIDLGFGVIPPAFPCPGLAVFGRNRQSPFAFCFVENWSQWFVAHLSCLTLCLSLWNWTGPIPRRSHHWPLSQAPCEGTALGER